MGGWGYEDEAAEEAEVEDAGVLVETGQSHVFSLALPEHVVDGWDSSAYQCEIQLNDKLFSFRTFPIPSAYSTAHILVFARVH